MQFFRRLISSRIGGYVALGFVILVSLAFAAGSISSNGGLGVFGPSSAQIAKIGPDSLTVNELQSRTQRIFERQRQEKPELTMTQFLAQGALRQIADEMISVKALLAYGAQHGMRISKKLVDAEIASNSAFADATGNFSQTQFDNLLAQQHVSEKDLREDISGQLIQQQLLAAAGAGAHAPDGMVKPYAAMLIEQRAGEMIAIPSAAYPPAKPATDAELKAFYAAHPEDFTIPEQRKLRYLLFSSARFDAQATPTDAEIAQAYQAKADEFAPRESRDFTQLILPTEKQAKDIAAEAQNGKLLSDLASKAGLAATRLNDYDQTRLGNETSPQIAKAAFGADKGTVIGPFKAPLGWTLLRVEDVRNIPGKSLEEAKATLIPDIRATKAKQLFAEFMNKLDGRLGEGASLDELAKANDVAIMETPLITVQGRDLNDSNYMPDEAVSALLKQGFAMSPDDDPQIVSIKPDEEAAILAPGAVVQAGPPPFEQNRPAAERAWTLQQGATRARAIAAKLTAALNKGTALEDALKQDDLTKMPRQPISARRIDLSQSGAVIPPPLKALFALNEGGAKMVPLEANKGFVVVRLDKVTADDPTANAPLLQSTKAGLGNALGADYARQLITAIELELKVSRNPAAIASVEAALRKANGAAQ